MMLINKTQGRISTLTCVIALFIFFWTFIFPRQILAQEKVTIPAGTVVTLRTTSVIAPEQLNTGDLVTLTVVNDVVIDGKVVIASGAQAKGEIIDSRNRGMIGIAAKIGLSVRSVTAVDNTTVPLMGSKIVPGKDKMVLSIGLSLICCILFALMKGGDASIPAGAQIEAQVAGTTSVIAN